MNITKEFPEFENLCFSKKYQKKFINIKKILIFFKFYIEQVFKKTSFIQLTIRIYIQLFNHLIAISEKKSKYIDFKFDLIVVYKAGFIFYNNYFEYIKKKNIYFIYNLLDPRIKT